MPRAILAISWNPKVCILIDGKDVRRGSGFECTRLFEDLIRKYGEAKRIIYTNSLVVFAW
mgnify:CR=1 FL=1